jgi:hypothetical protein
VQPEFRSYSALGDPAILSNGSYGGLGDLQSANLPGSGDVEYGSGKLSCPIQCQAIYLERLQELVLDIQKTSGMDGDFLGAWRKALDAVEALGTARNFFVSYEDRKKHETSDSDEAYTPGKIYRRKKKVKQVKQEVKQVKQEGRT